MTRRIGLIELEARSLQMTLERPERHIIFVETRPRSRYDQSSERSSIAQLGGVAAFMHWALVTRSWETARLLALVTAVTWASAFSTAGAAELIRPYKSAVTRIFLSKYYAFPIFVQNPLFPGQILDIGNETLFKSDCYDNQRNGNYVRIEDYIEGVDVKKTATSAIGGDILRNIGEIELDGGVRFEKTVTLTISPLSIDRFEPDTYAMRNWNMAKEGCALIKDLLNGTSGGYFLIAEVLHGKVNFRFNVNFSESLSASARANTIVKISRLFGLDEADVGVSALGASFSVSSSPAPKTQAIVPAYLNSEELARITYFLQGERGASLEIAVNEALRAEDLSIYTQALVWIRNILGDEINNQNKWAERFIAGGNMVSVEDLRRKGGDDINMRDIANYAAGMILVGGGEI